MPLSTGLVYDKRFLDHVTGPAHPERPHRLLAIIEHLHKTGLWDRLQVLPATPADLKWVRKVHDQAYLDRLQQACLNHEAYIDCPDSAICPASYEVALLAAGGVLAAVDAVRQGPPAGVRNAFCAVRPPGHHAEHDQSLGFCLLNNVAIAAEYLIAHHAVERLAIVDFDVHHGNGTQHHFEDRPDVLFITLHEHPTSLYPGTGHAWETGRGPGDGYTINLPMNPGEGDREYRHAFLNTVLPALDRYRPQFLLLSAGFDASEYDPLAHMKVSVEGFAWMTRQLKMVAERHCDGQLVSVLEGGYDLRALADCVAAHIGILLQPEGHDDLMERKAGLW